MKAQYATVIMKQNKIAYFFKMIYDSEGYFYNCLNTDDLNERLNQISGVLNMNLN